MEAKTLKNTLKASVLYICIIALLYRNFIRIYVEPSATSPEVWIPMVELNHGGSTSSDLDSAFQDLLAESTYVSRSDDPRYY